MAIREIKALQVKLSHSTLRAAAVKPILRGCIIQTNQLFTGLSWREKSIVCHGRIKMDGRPANNCTDGWTSRNMARKKGWPVRQSRWHLGGLFCNNLKRNLQHFRFFSVLTVKCNVQSWPNASLSDLIKSRIISLNNLFVANLLSSAAPDFR